MKFFQEIQRKSNESQDNRDAYERDYDSSVSGMDDSNKTNFKRQELQHELGHERNNIAININGRTWKVVPCKGTADSKEEWSHLNNMKSWAERKSASTGKKWTVSLTGAPVSETVKPEVQQTVTENEDSPVLGAIIHRIMVGRTDLLAKYGPKLILAAAENVADYVGDVEEIGSSDVSGWVKQVERMLEENPPEAFGEAAGKRPVAPDPQNYDSDWDYYNDQDEDEEEMKDDVDYENMIDEVGRRGFLKGMGAAGVAEGNDGYDDESTRDEYTNLQSGDYVRDSQDSSGEVFIMRGQPDDRRVRIEDKDGRGWNIAPYRLIAVDADDAAIGHYFNGVAEASNTMQRYGQKIQQRVKAAREAEARERAEQEKSEKEKSEKEKKGVAEDSVNELDLKKKAITTQKIPNDIVMLVHKLKKDIPLRSDEYQKLLAYNAFRKGSMQTQEDYNPEYDDEAGMAKSNLRTLARAVNGLIDTIGDDENLPEWAQEKIAKAEMMATGVWDYLLSQEEQGIDPKVDEASLAQMRDYFSQTDSNTVAVDTEYGAPERKQRANVPPEIQTLINKMYRVGKITPQEFDILKRFQAKTGMNVGIKEADMTTGNQGYDSMLAVMKAVDAGQDATFNLGGEPVTLEYPEARFLAGKYKAFLKAGRQEEFLKYMENPMAFDRLMKQLRDLIDKQKNFKGSVPGERGIEEASLSKDQYLAQKKALQDIQLDPETAKDPELRKELMSRTDALRKQAIASGHIAESLPKTNEGYYWCSLNKKSKLIPEGYKKIASGYITRK